MCGIVGFTNNIDDSNRVIGEMMDRIRHRGPDAEGKYIDEDIALGHRRLSIIDISASGDQPIFNEDGSKVIVFNGEIYNYREIREKLLSAGHVFKTNTDTEVLIHGYEEYGTNLLNMLRGMFSFVIWDKNKRELFGARDFFGIKPMYYAIMGKSARTHARYGARSNTILNLQETRGFLKEAWQELSIDWCSLPLNMQFGVTCSMDPLDGCFHCSCTFPEPYCFYGNEISMRLDLSVR